MDENSKRPLDSKEESRDGEVDNPLSGRKEDAETRATLDDGMGAAYPPLPDENSLYPEPGQDVQVEEAESEDKGLSAYFPVFREGELPPLPDEPLSQLPLPSTDSTRGAPLFSPAAYVEPGPTVGLSSPVHVSKDHPSSMEMIELLITNERVGDMWQRTHKAQQEVNSKINSLAIARGLLDQIQCARNEILAGKDHIEEAERALNEVEYRIELSERVAKWSYSIGSALVLYEIVWFALAIVGMLLASPWLFNFVQVQGVGPASPTWPAEQWAEDIVLVFNSMMWGVLGGVTGALYALWIHISRDQDFDKQYSMWYILSPIGGFVVGAFVFLVVRLGVFSLTAGQEATITSPLVLYALAWLSGYQQNVVYDLVKRILGLFRVDVSSATGD